MNRVARLVSIDRAGFGSDSAEYTDDDGKLRVIVGWALLSPYFTRVFRLGDDSRAEMLAEYLESGYIQPAEALSRMGYTVHGTVDFAAGVDPV